MKAVRLTSEHELPALGQCEEMASGVCTYARRVAHSWAGMGVGATWACTEWRGEDQDRRLGQDTAARVRRAEVGSVSGGAVALGPDDHVSVDPAWVRPASGMRAAAWTWTRSQVGHSLEIAHLVLDTQLPRL